MSDLAHDADRIRCCVRCETALPLRVAGPNEVAIDWECVTCGQFFTARLDTHAPEHRRGNVRPVRFRLAEESLPPPPPRLHDFLFRFEEDEPVEDRRDSERRPLILNVPTLMVDAEYQPMGRPFITVSRDVSASGISLVHNRHIPSENILVQLPIFEKQVQIVTQIVRQESLGPFVQIGGRFLARFDPPCVETASQNPDQGN